MKSGPSVNTHNIGIYPKAMRKSTRLPYFYPPPQSRLTNMSLCAVLILELSVKSWEGAGEVWGGGAGGGGVNWGKIDHQNYLKEVNQI